MVRKVPNNREGAPASTSEVEKASGKLPPNKPMQEVDDEVDPEDADGGACIDQNEVDPKDADGGARIDQNDVDPKDADGGAH